MSQDLFYSLFYCDDQKLDGLYMIGDETNEIDS